MQYESYALRQIRVTTKFYWQLKEYCRQHRKKMFNLYADALTWFLTKYAVNPFLYYYASCKNGRCLSLWIHKEQIQKIQQIARSARVSDARVIATALMVYLNEKHIF